ncbi:MAG: hypothetical protein ACOCZ5_03415 [bacterium]
MSLSTFKEGNSRCPICFRKNNFYSYEFVDKFITDNNHTLISTKYKNADTKLKIKCPKGHLYIMSFYNFKLGHMCPICRNEKRGNERRFSYSYVKNVIEKEGYKLISDNYKNNSTKLKIQCPKGHIYETKFLIFLIGCRCPYCSGTKRLTNQEIINSLKLYENIRENEDEEIEVTCAYCNS